METENAIYRKDFLSFKKKSKTKNQFYNNHFRKVVISTQYRMRYMIYIPPNTKTRNRSYDGC